ncbi:MAG: class I SAM-dependent methyltransferase [Candidatus Peribacteraceae bacterium]|nr:class I SAM-dependent methyltransferase [Candidatus Peribacteraceae bacterium]
MTQHDDRWKIWDDMQSYGEVLYKRATGEAPEMESSKAAARRLKGILKQEDTVLDVGCGAGHYLRSLRNTFSFPFRYTGIDATQSYVDLATKAFKDDPDAKFLRGDIEALPVQDQSFDIVLCMNVLLHLPRILPAIRELWRVTGQTLLIRTMVGEKSFHIKQIREWEKEMEGMEDPLFDADGEPLRFHYFNIYSEQYVRWICSTLPGVASCTIEQDKDFNPEAISAAHWPDKTKPRDLTQVLGGQQVNGSIIEPWAFVRIDRT